MGHYIATSTTTGVPQVCPPPPFAPSEPVHDAPVHDAVHVARQPIFAADGSLHGWELLFRDPGGALPGDDPDRATARVLVSAFCEIGAERLVGDRPAFVNVGDTFLLSRLAHVLPPDGVVLEILEDVRAEPGIVAVAEDLARAGYQLALDDFAFEPGNEALLPLADYVKIDVLATSTDDLPRLLATVHAHGAQAVAEKIETAEMYEYCRQLGFSYFQGYWLSRPEPQSFRALTPSRVTCLQLMSLLLHESPDLDEVDAVLSTDPALTLRVLRMVNSASIGLRHQVTSVRHAVALVGATTLASWFVLMHLAESDETDADGASAVAASDLLVRARMCALLAERDAGHAGGRQGFLAGVLAGLALALGVPAGELLGQIGVADDVAQAVLSHTGELGDILYDVEEYLTHPLDRVGPDLSTISSIPRVRTAYLDALGWSEATLAKAMSAGV
jgi:EAL and modified HD-GYP domain-containing signal transduction protein